MAHRDNSMLSPTSQGGLSRSLTEVIAARNSGELDYYWRCLETLYITCLALKRGSNELEQQIDPIFQKVKKISASGYFMASTQTRANRDARRFQMEQCNEIYKIIMIFLRENNYAETALGAQPINKQVERMGLTTQ